MDGIQPCLLENQERTSVPLRNGKGEAGEEPMARRDSVRPWAFEQRSGTLVLGHAAGVWKSVVPLEWNGHRVPA